MGIASVYVDVEIGSANLHVVEVFAKHFFPHVLSPKQIAFSANERAFSLLPGSLPQAPPDRSLLPCERLTEDSDLTICDRDAERIEWSSDGDHVLRAWEQWRKEHWPQHPIVFRAWGPALLYHRTQSGVERDWFLRERLEFRNGALFVPILECALSMDPEDGVQLELYSESHVWSEFGHWDRGLGWWRKKSAEEYELARKNVAAVVSALHATLSDMGDCTYRWSVNDVGHIPNLKPLLQAAMRESFGEDRESSL